MRQAAGVAPGSDSSGLHCVGLCPVRPGRRGMNVTLAGVLRRILGVAAGGRAAK